MTMGGRTALLMLVLGACNAAASRDVPTALDLRDAAMIIDAAPAFAPKQPLAAGSELPAYRRYPSAASAVLDIIPPTARVLGFGELHVRGDRAQVPSALTLFKREISPAIAPKVSDLVLETWVVDPRCAAKGAAASRRIANAMKRPGSTSDELAQQIGTGKNTGVKFHVLRLTCDDYDVVAPESGLNIEALLSLVTRELGRIAVSAVTFRDKDPAHRPWIALYGGALHNDRFPVRTVAEWSYVATVEKNVADGFVEIDLIVPELAEDDVTSQGQPWFPLVRQTAPGHGVVVWQRGERSWVIILPRSSP